MVPEDQSGKRRPRKKVVRELPEAGTMFIGRSKGRVFEAEVVPSAEHPNKRALSVQGKEYASLSGAAKAVTGHSVNGWVFWKLVNGT